MVSSFPVIGRRTTVSAAAFTGRAVPPGAAQIDSTTTNVINKNSLQLGVVSNQIQNLTAQVNSLAGSMQVVARNLTVSQTLERQKEQQEALLERKLAEQKIREGAESALERKLEAKTIRPAQKLAGQAQGILSRLSGFFTALLGGWLLTRGVRAIKLFSEGNTKELRRLGESVVSNLIKMRGTMMIAKGALALLTGRYRAMASLILTGVGLNLFSKPASQLLTFLVELAAAAARKIPFVGDLFGNSEDPPKDFGDNDNGGGNDNIDTNQDAREDYDPIDSTSPPDSFEDPGDGLGGQSLIEPTEPAAGSGESLRSIAEALNPAPTASAEAQTGMMMQPMDFSGPAMFGEGELSVNIPLQANFDVDAGQAYSGDTTYADMGFSAAEIQGYINDEKYIGKYGTLPPDMFTSMSRERTATIADTVSQSTEPGVTVVPFTAPSQEQPQQQTVTPGGTTIGGSTPSYPTSNSDNIYTMGAYSTYNVVPN